MALLIVFSVCIFKGERFQVFIAGKSYNINLERFDEDYIKEQAKIFCISDAVELKMRAELVEKGCVVPVSNMLFMEINNKRRESAELSRQQQLKDLANHKQFLQNQESTQQVEQYVDSTYDFHQETELLNDDEQEEVLSNTENEQETELLNNTEQKEGLKNAENEKYDDKVAISYENEPVVTKNENTALLDVYQVTIFTYNNNE